jgi:hypothetical protein
MVAEFKNPFFEQNADDLAAFLASLLNVNAYDLGDDPQKTIAGYIPPPGFVLSEKQRATQKYFASMGPKAFSCVYLVLQMRHQQRGGE